CEIGQYLKENCHLPVYTKGKSGYISGSDLIQEDQELFTLRTGVPLQPSSQIYLHHKMKFLDKFAEKQRRCSDPLNLHPGKARTKNLRIITRDCCERLRELTGSAVKPGEKLCPTCAIRIN
ncbi:hypothetical protein CAPTEDRAFT_88075, partial [Capitella teleta]